MQVGRCQLVRRLAVGGMAEIYLARLADMTVVVKRLLPALATDPEQRAMFLQEARIGEPLEHPHIVTVYGHGEVDGAPYIVMEHVAGVDLRRLGAAARDQGSRIPAQIVLTVLLEVCDALAYAHNQRDARGRLLNLVHRDVTPSNVVVSYQGVTKLLDFGIAKVRLDSVKTQAGMVKGKVPYLAPELIQQRPMDHRVDLWCLGIVLYELLMGQRPFQAKTEFGTLEAILKAPIPPLVDQPRGLKGLLEGVIGRALERDPARRYADAVQMARDIAMCLRRVGGPADATALGEYVRTTCTADFQQDLAAELGEVSFDMPKGPLDVETDGPARQRARRSARPPEKARPQGAAHSMPRRFPRIPVAFEVVGQWWNPDSTPSELRADLVWLSEGGMMLRCHAPVRANATVSFTVTHAPRELSLDLKGTVRWWRRVGATRELGISLEAPVPAIGRYVSRHLAES